MAFDPETPPPPAAIGRINVILSTWPDGIETVAGQSATFQVYLLDENGIRIRMLSGNLVPHITQAQINGLLNFMAALRTQGEEQLLP